ncbi:MAG: class I SAM-dependent RNA methyltransferase [Myxococcota bacterium]
METVRAFAACAPGLEDVVSADLARLGIPGRPGAGGVAFDADDSTLARAHLGLGSALFVSLEVGSFGAKGFEELEKKGARLPWNRFIEPGRPVRFKVTTSKSRLYHTGAIAQRLEALLSRSVGDPDPSMTPLHIRVNVQRDTFRLWIDASNPALRQRGYRLHPGKAPLREDLAYALLSDAGVGPGFEGLIWDPFCGVGTIPIEAALKTQNQAPCLFRSFAFESFPWFDPVRLEEERERAQSRLVPADGTSILGSDRNPKAIEHARANAQTAGIAHRIRFASGTLQERLADALSARRGVLVCNPPYGRRLSGQRNLRLLFQALGAAYRRLGPGWRLAMVSADPRWTAATGLSLQTTRRVDHGGIQIALLVSST